MSIQRRRSAETRRRISHGLLRFNERKRLADRIRPRDLARLGESGSVAQSLRPVLNIAENEMAEIVALLRGADAIPPTKRALIEDAVERWASRCAASWHATSRAADLDAASPGGTLGAPRRRKLAVVRSLRA